MLPQSIQRPRTLSYPVRAYLLGLSVAVVSMFTTSLLHSGLFAPGKLLLALALATVPQLVLGRALNWSPVTHATHEHFSLNAAAAAVRAERPQLKSWQVKLVAMGDQRLSATLDSLGYGFIVCGFLYAILIAFPW